MGRKTAAKASKRKATSDSNNLNPDSNTTDSSAVQILPYLYLGPRSAAGSESFIRSRGITHVLSIGASPPPGSKLAGVSYTKVPMLDGPGGSVESVLERARSVLDDVRVSNLNASSSLSGTGEIGFVVGVDGTKNPGSASRSSPRAVKGKEKLRMAMGPKTQKKVLIHCSAGLSRSPSLVAAYLMSSPYDMTLKQSLGMIIRARPAVNPNPELFRQLKEMEVRIRGSGSLEGVESLPARKEESMKLFEEEDRNEADGNANEKTEEMESTVSRLADADAQVES